MTEAVRTEPDCAPVKALVRALVKQVLTPSMQPFHDALYEMTQEVSAANKGVAPSNYRATVDMFRAVLKCAGIKDIPSDVAIMVDDATDKVTFDGIGPTDPDSDPLALISHHRSVTGCSSASATMQHDGVQEELTLFDDLPAITDDSVTMQSSKLIQYARHELLPSYAAKELHRPHIKCYRHESVLYAIILTESGLLMNGGRMNINFTVDPFRSALTTPPNVSLYTSNGRRAQARLVDPDDIEHKWWAQFIYHKPGRKLRFFGSKEIGKDEWADVPSATRYLVMADTAPWLRQVTLDEFRKLPNVDG